MKARFLKLLMCGIALASATGACLAAADTAPAATATAVTAPQSVAEILQFQHALRDKLESRTGEYSKFDESSVHRMEADQDKIFHMLAGVTSMDQLNESQKIDLSNSMDAIKSTLLAQQNDRMICHIEHKIGSNLTERRCETVSQRAARTREAEQFMSHDRLMSPSYSGGGH